MRKLLWLKPDGAHSVVEAIQKARIIFTKRRKWEIGRRKSRHFRFAHGRPWRFSAKHVVAGLLILACLSTGCNSDSRDIRDYYFPVRRLTDGLVYEYAPVRDSLPPTYWYYHSLLLDTAIYLTATNYDAAFNQTQTVREELVGNGMLLAELFLYEPDSTGLQQSVAAEVLAGNVFPFSVNDSNTVYLYKVRFQLPSQAPANSTVIINRRFLGDTIVTYQDESYDAVVFGLRGVVEIRDTVAGGMEPAFTGREVYAEGLGLVAYERTFGAQSLAYRLRDRYPMSRLEEKARSQQ